MSHLTSSAKLAATAVAATVLLSASAMGQTVTHYTVDIRRHDSTAVPIPSSHPGPITIEAEVWDVGAGGGQGTGFAMRVSMALKASGGALPTVETSAFKQCARSGGAGSAPANSGGAGGTSPGLPSLPGRVSAPSAPATSMCGQLSMTITPRDVQLGRKLTLVIHNSSASLRDIAHAYITVRQPGS